MKKLIGSFGDRLQAIFTPNRVAILLAGPITAAAAWISGTIAANIPGVQLPVGVIAGVMGVAVIITVRLLDRWFDQWQAGEPLTFDEDLEKALAELEETTTAFLAEHGTMQQVGVALQGLHDRLSKGSIHEAEVTAGVSEVLDLIAPRALDTPDAPGAPATIEPPHPESAAPSSPPAAPAPAA